MKEEIRSGERTVVGLSQDGEQVDKKTASKQDVDCANSGGLGRVEGPENVGAFLLVFESIGNLITG